MTPSEFVSFALAGFVVAMLIGLLIRGALGLFVLGVAALIAPWFYLNHRAKRRRKQFMEQLADMAQMMGNSMRAGFSIIQSMELVGNEGPSPAKEEFERVVTEVKLGLPLDTALEHLYKRQPSEDLELMIVAVNVQRQIGGNLSEILAVISQTIRERVRFQRDLKALTAQARYSSYIITALPVCVALIINWMDEPYESFLYTTTLGYIMLGVALCMLGLGFFFLNKIANIEV
jgi:tight adherence protein B